MQPVNTKHIKEEKKIPNLRFPGFEGGWEIQPLKKISKFLDNKRIPLSESERQKRKGPYPYYGASGIIDNIDDYIFDGEYVLLGEDGANIVNRSTALAFVVSGKIWVNNHAHIIEAYGSTHFLAESLERIRYEKYNTGTAQPKLNADVCKKIPIALPSLPEQKKIASFLSAVDQKIQQLTRKKELLELYKKGVMQKIFPPVGGQAPEIRFRNENGNNFPDWEEKRLGELAEIRRGASPRPISDPKWFDPSSKIGWVRISDVTRSNKYLDKTEQYLSEEGIRKSRLVEKGNMIMSICATIGKSIYTNFKVCIHDGFVVFENLKANKEYLYYFLDKIQLSWYKYGQPGTQVNLNTNIVGNENIPYPSFPEQKRIAGFLSSIDEKIEFVKNNITQTQKFKKGLLQQMFV